MSAKISVAMATYNGENYIIEQLESILNQTFSDFEFLISNDGTANVIRNYVKERKLENIISFSINEFRLGYASNFVSALKETTGDFVFFSDQDDIWTCDRVEKMVGALEKNSDISLLGSEFEPFKSSSDAPDAHRWELKKFRNDGSIEKICFNSENIFIGCQGCTMVMRRSFIDKAIIYWYGGWAHDEFVWKIALAGDELYFYHVKTLKRRLHSNNVTLHKEHEKSKRLNYLVELRKSHEQTVVYLENNCRGKRLSDNEVKRRVNLLNRHIKATDLRIELLKNRSLFNVFKLLRYVDCYHKARSIPVEFMMALK